jgi:deoxyribodipyrimidine photolyase-related protein
MKNKIRNLLVLFNDQIAFPIKQNENFDKKQDYILFIEPAEFFFKSNHHKKKLVFILSSFRNYAEELKKENYNILYEKIEDNVQRDTINIICDKYLKEYHIEKLTFIEPSDYDLEQNIKKIKHEKEILIDNSFYCNKLEFKKWAEAQKNILMENFYRYLRKKHNILIENNKPTGGKWNFDSMNRESINKKTMIKKQNLYFPENNFIKKIIKVVDTFFKDNIGNTSNYNFGYTKKDAKLRINYFFKNHLKEFGKFQDAMVEENEYINHSIISMYLNNGLLKPKDVIDSCKKKSRYTFKLTRRIYKTNIRMERIY